MSRPCERDHSPSPRSCRLCWLYENDAGYRALWDGPAPPAIAPARSLPCVHLGTVLDRRGCPCPGRWLRKCGLHGTCTVETCKTCADYEGQ
jgi:hypothetical protein